MTPNQRVRVLHVIPSLNRGGAEMVVVNLCNNFDLSNFEVRIATLTAKIPLAAKLTRPNETKVISLGIPDRSHPLVRMFHGLRLRQVVADFRPHIVHSHMWALDSPIQWLATVGLATSQVVTIHTTGLHYAPGSAKQYLLRFAEIANINLSRAYTVGVSEAVSKVAIKRLSVSSNRLTTIYNGIDTKTFSINLSRPISRELLGANNSSPIAVIVGSMHEHKAHRYLLDAWKHVTNAFPLARLVCVGDGPLRPQLQRYSQDLRIDSTVRFLGHRDDIAEILAACDLAVVPSLFEGLPVSAIEASAMSLPVVGTSIPGLDEVVVDGETGVLVAPATVEPLAQALIRLLKDAPLRMRMGDAARKRAVQLFSVQKQARRHEELYRMLINRKGVRISEGRT